MCHGRGFNSTQALCAAFSLSLGNFTRVGLYENDIATLLHIHNPPLESILSELAKCLNASDLEQVKQIVGEIQQRLKRFEERS